MEEDVKVVRDLSVWWMGKVYFYWVSDSNNVVEECGNVICDIYIGLIFFLKFIILYYFWYLV